MSYAQAQTKVFREVSEDMSSEVKAIRQDNTLVGYLVFTQLEKASADSFNYKITIMDENLNDIGNLTFREMKLDLQAVSFEQDVLCLAYLKSVAPTNKIRNRRTFDEALKKLNPSVFLQFVSLDGKILKSYNHPVEFTPRAPDYWENYFNAPTHRGILKYALQLSNVPQKGICLLFWG